MTSLKEIRPEARVKARMHQLESAVATSEHLSKHPDQFRKRLDKGKHFPDSDSGDEDASEDFAELLRNLTLDAGSGGGKEALREAFKILDCDEDGFITLADLRESLSGFEEDEDDDEKLTDEDLLEMIAAADTKGSGKIGFESFVRILEPKKGKKKANSKDNKPLTKSR